MGKILSVGCGTKSYAMADVLLDLYETDSSQRRSKPGNIQLINNQKFVQGDVQDMHMFKNKEFDFIYAEHVLEHVDYPEKACAELCRVGKAGVIRTPSAFSEILFGWEYHKWLTFERNKKIFFLQKRNYEHIPFGRFFRKTIGKNAKYEKNIIPEIKKVYDANKYLFDTVLSWKDVINFEVVRN